MEVDEEKDAKDRGDPRLLRLEEELERLRRRSGVQVLGLEKKLEQQAVDAAQEKHALQVEKHALQVESPQLIN